MTTTALEPMTTGELAELVRATPHVIAVGAGTKPRLSQVSDKFIRVSARALRGILEYEPAEFTFTARAGTPLREIVAALVERGQHLPFDPMLADAGATLGGTIAAGLSGPGRWRYGGLRDFILGVQFVDGDGRLLRLGGKVVKNAAGFDVPKFLVGSAGRFGVITEATFKVFPRPAGTRTLRLDAPDAAVKAMLFTAAARSRWEIETLDAALEEGAVYVRLGAPVEALDSLVQDILSHWSGSVLTGGDAAYLWQSISGFRWAHASGTLAKLALTPRQTADFIVWVRKLEGARAWLSGGGNVGFVSVPTGVRLPTAPWPAMTLRGDAPLWGGVRRDYEIMRAVKSALDPSGRFPGMND